MFTNFIIVIIIFEIKNNIIVYIVILVIKFIINDK